MENPYDSSPYSPSTADAWWFGFLRGYIDPLATFEVPWNVSESDAAPYGEGVQAGRQAGVDGLMLGNTCIPAGEGDPDNPIASGLWGTWSVGAFFSGVGGPAAFVARGLVTLLRLSLHTKNTVDPNWVLPQVMQPLMDEMQRAGVPHGELYLGIGRDALSTDCEFLATGLYSSIDNARSAVQQQGRPGWIITGWRTDQSGFRIVEESGY